MSQSDEVWLDPHASHIQPVRLKFVLPSHLNFRMEQKHEHFGNIEIQMA